MTTERELTLVFAQKLVNQQMVDIFFEFNDGQRFGAHSIILAAQSATFKEVMKDGNSIKIINFPASSFRKLIDVIYCMDISIDDFEQAEDLYKLGNKYDIPDAVAMARIKFIRHYCDTQEEALKLHDFAVVYDDERLKKYCISCFENGIKEYFGFSKNKSGNPFVFEIQETSSEVQDLLQSILNLYIKDQTNVEKLISDGLGFFKALYDAAFEIFYKILPFSHFDESEYSFQINRKTKPSFDTDTETQSSSDPDTSINTMKIYPVLNHSRPMKNKDFRQFKFVTIESEMWLQVHWTILETNCPVLFSTPSIEEEEDFVEIKNATFEAFYSMINKMYDLSVNFSTHNEAFEFYSTCKQFGYLKGIEFAQDFFIKNLQKDDIQTLYEFAKTHQDATLENYCLKFYEKKVEDTIDEILYPNECSEELVLDAPNDAKSVLSKAIEAIRNEPKLETKLSMALNCLNLFKKFMLNTAKTLFPFDDVDLTFERNESFLTSDEEENSSSSQEEEEEEESLCYCGNGPMSEILRCENCKVAFKPNDCVWYWERDNCWYCEGYDFCECGLCLRMYGGF